MGNLASYLQQSFRELCPRGWTCRPEVRLLPLEIEQLLGYSSRADVVLEREDGSRRIWIEFEVSRADPVANHAKFAVAHHFQPQQASDSFVSMVSAHVNRGRRNLAASTINLMRHIGMDAFQTALLPFSSTDEIKLLNHLSLEELPQHSIRVEDELARAIAVSQVVIGTDERRLYLVGDVLEAILNLRGWNRELESPELRALWRKRTVTYFVFDPFSRMFAPSKFCGYAVVPNRRGEYKLQESVSRATMTIQLYVSLDGNDGRFDGRHAWQHLTKGLAMTAVAADEAPGIVPLFGKWLDRHTDAINVHPSGPIFITPPAWFR